MLSEEKAIIEVRKLRDANKRNSLGKSIETVLNLYENNQKKIGELQKENEELNKKIYLCTPEIPQCQHGKYTSYSDLIDKIIIKDKEIKEKDKQIDLMAEELTTPINSKEWIKEYYKNLARQKG